MFISSNSIKTIKLSPGEPGFNIVDKFVVTPRASLEISGKCPNEHKWIIQQCIENGWLKAVANVRDHELMWDNLAQQ